MLVPSAPTAAVLTLEALCVGRGDRVLLRDFHLRLMPGTVLHLKGRNGAGKTSLLEVIAGLRPAQAGALRLPTGGLHWLGHKNGLNPALSPSENLGFWCSLNRCPESGIVAGLERLGVGRLRHKPCRSLSEGQKRRVALSRLLLQARPLWLLDEPLAALDAAGLELFGGLIAAHCASGGAALVTSHQALPGLAGQLVERELG